MRVRRVREGRRRCVYFLSSSTATIMSKLRGLSYLICGAGWKYTAQMSLAGHRKENILALLPQPDPGFRPAQGAGAFEQVSQTNGHKIKWIYISWRALFIRRAHGWLKFLDYYLFCPEFGRQSVLETSRRGREVLFKDNDTLDKVHFAAHLLSTFFMILMLM